MLRSATEHIDAWIPEKARLLDRLKQGKFNVPDFIFVPADDFKNGTFDALNAFLEDYHDSFKVIARSGHPLVVLIGGTTGTGKSTIATEVAHRLSIVRTQSSDMLREVMRMMIPKRLLPVLHTSSFNAGFTLPATGGEDDYDNQLADGYLTQSDLLSVPCEAVIQRALRERVSVILEGVHLHPGMLKHLKLDKSAHVIMIMLAVLEPDQLKRRLSGRLLEAPERKSSGHLSQFDKIWHLQSFLLSEADRCGVPIFMNDDKEKVTNAIMATLIDTLAKGFDQTPDKVFAPPRGKDNA